MATRAGYGGGSLRSRGDRRWELRVCTGRDPVKGRYRYVSRTVTGTRKAAEAALAALVTQVNTGVGGHTGTDATVGELIEQWLDLKRDALSVTTWEGYVGKARFRLIPALGKVAVRKLTVRDIDAFYRALVREEKLAASTIRQIHNVLTGSLDQAVRWGWRTDNPARLATLPSVRQGDVRPPTPADVMAAIERADQELATFIRVAAVVGGRRGEVGALRWTNIDLTTGELTITKALVETRDRSILEKDTKTHQARRVALDAATIDALRSWHAALQTRAQALDVSIRSDGFVFSPEFDGSKPWRPYHWTSAWRRLRDRIGIDPAVRLHDLRHFTATRLLDAGVPVKTVSSRLGHARPATMLNVYAHFIPATDRVAADLMGQLLMSSTAVVESPICPHLDALTRQMTDAGSRLVDQRDELRDRVRREDLPPDESQVVLRGGPDTGLLIRSHARRVNRLFVLDGAEVWAISVFVALDDVGTGSAKTILQTKLRSYDYVYLPTAGRLRQAGFELLATFARPHFSVLMPGLDTVSTLLEALGELQINPYAGEVE